MFNKIYVKIKNFIIVNKTFLAFLLFLIIMLHFPLPYVVYTPGGYIELTDRIKIEDSSKAKGSFNMSYVSVLHATPAVYLLSYIMPNWDLEKNDNITLENQSIEELETYQKLNMEAGFDNAQMVAFKHAGHPVKDSTYNLNIMYIFDYAKTDLKIGDILLSIDNKKINSLDSVMDILKSHKIGDVISMQVIRNGKHKNVTSELVNIENEAKIGIMFIETYDFETHKNVEFTIDKAESGPSGGLLMTLQIYDYLVKEDLTQGLKIAGTGTIDKDGNVGQIDGIKYKLLGSKDVDIFFCPEDNYKEAIEVVKDNKLDIKVIKVKTFYDAVEYLNNLK